MRIQRLFQSATMNPASGTAGSPSGVSGGLSAPAVPLGGYGTATFPAIAAGGGLLVTNDGRNTLRLFFQDGSSAPTLTSGQIFAESTGTLLIPPGKFVVLTTIVAGCGVSYCGGPWSAVPGSFTYTLLLDPADHPAAATLI